MRPWAPPPGTIAEFRLKDDASAAAVASVGITIPRDGYCKLRLSDKRWPALLDALTAVLPGEDHLFTSNWFIEPEPKTADAEWFIPWPARELENVRTAPADLHYAYRRGLYLCSDRFIATIESHGLTGLDWLSLTECHPDDPRQWFELFATTPLGRGLDHPLFNRAAYEVGYKNRPFDMSRRHGQDSTRGGHDGLDRIDDPLLRRIIAASPPKQFNIRGPRRFVREFLPATDFAYCGWASDRDRGPGSDGRQARTICCNARARQILLDAGLLTAFRFQPLLIVAEADANAPILDREIDAPLPPPVYTPSEAAAERTRRAAAPLPPPPPRRPRLKFKSFDHAIRTLQHRLDNGTTSWLPAQRDPDAASILEAIALSDVTDAWRIISPLLPLRVVDEDEDGGSPFIFEMCAPRRNDWLPVATPEGRNKRPSSDDLVIGESPFGDDFTVRRTDPNWPRDARVYLWDHETASINRQWPGIVAFIAYLIDLCDRKARG